MVTFRERYALIQEADDKRHELIKNLLDEVDETRSNLNAVEMERDQAKATASNFWKDFKNAEAESMKMQKMMNHNAFVLVLIDGDCMNFLDDLVKKLELGGEEAAQLLRSSIENYVREELSDLQMDLQIIVQIYGNLRGLGKTLVDNLILDHAEDLGRFICGFNKKFALFEFVDAGNGKECSDAKLKSKSIIGSSWYNAHPAVMMTFTPPEIFEVYIRNVHCKHVIFGGSADNGYARLLSPYTGDAFISNRITMLEGPPFGKELTQIVDKFRQCSFPEVFRNAKIPARRVSFSTTPPKSISPGPPSYAFTAASAKAENLNFITPSKADTVAKDIVPRNAQGERVDPPLKVSQAALMSLRAKGKKWCNNRYLLGYCAYQSTCQFEHEEPLNDAQKTALRSLARQAPCTMGLDCDDVDCVFGHKCPGKPCTYGSACRFLPEMHNVDSKVVSC